MQANGGFNKERAKLGAFNTVNSGWLFPQVQDFVIKTGAHIAVDPYAGDWDLLKSSSIIGAIVDQKGYDILPRNGSIHNDSLLHVPPVKDGIIMTNPPYFAAHVAKRKKAYDDLSRYYEDGRSDLYEVALDRCLASYAYGVFIIPETFISSKYPKYRLAQLTVVESNLFQDTEMPVCVACFDDRLKSEDEVSIYRENQLLLTLGGLNRLRMKPHKSFEINMNDPEGVIALRAVDGAADQARAGFMTRDEIDFPADKIKNSRVITYVSIPAVPANMVQDVINAANAILQRYRTQTHDLALSAFLSSRTDGLRRRRIDYTAARAILEQAVEQLGIQTHPTHMDLWQ